MHSVPFGTEFQIHDWARIKLYRKGQRVANHTLKGLINADAHLSTRFVYDRLDTDTDADFDLNTLTVGIHETATRYVVEAGESTQPMDTNNDAPPAFDRLPQPRKW